jgi:hypothetical protein
MDEPDQAELDRQESETRANIKAASDEWRKRWPNHCTACAGWGGSTFRQSHPYGMGSATETLFESCEELPEDACHRCGAFDTMVKPEQEITKPIEEKCVACGWSFDDGDPIVGM